MYTVALSFIRRQYGIIIWKLVKVVKPKEENKYPGLLLLTPLYVAFQAFKNCGW